MSGVLCPLGLDFKRNVVRNNFIHHIPRANAIYGDDGHAGDSIYNNVVYRALVGTIIGGGHYNYISHNLYAGCTTAGISIDARGKQRNYNAGNPDFCRPVPSLQDTGRNLGQPLSRNQHFPGMSSSGTPQGKQK